MFVFSAVLAFQTATSVAITGGTVIDGTGAAPRPNTTIIVQGEWIAAIGPAAEVAVPAGALRIDATGKFVLPGFIDLHVHLMYPPTDAPQSDGVGVLRALRFMNLFQAAGVTALRDVGGTVPVMALGSDGSIGVPARDDGALEPPIELHHGAVAVRGRLLDEARRLRGQRDRLLRRRCGRRGRPTR